MGKFPAIRFFSGVANLVAILVLVGGAIAAWRFNTMYGDFNFFGFLISLIPFIATAVSVRLLAELLDLAVRVEEHLEKIAFNSSRKEKM